MKRRLHLAAVIVTLLLLTIAAGTMVSAAQPRDAKVQNVTIRNLKYDPAKITVKVGQTVVWTNQDDHDHTIIARDGSFKTEDPLGRGERFRHTFKKPGKYEYYCNLHPRMKAVVIVEE